MMHRAQAQITTVQYAQQNSPRNVFAPDLGFNSSFPHKSPGNALQKNQKLIMLGMNQHDNAQEDQEANKKGQINLSEL